jgi:SAM-dependent methyltransferase
MTNYKEFYDENRDIQYGEQYTTKRAKDHLNYNELLNFINIYSLKEKKCLEIGSSGGGFQDMVDDYYGTDIAESLKQYYHKPYKVSHGEEYPFNNNKFDAIWSLHVYEHIPHLQNALLEIKRLIKKNGVVLFSPAWQSRPWAAQGYEVRPYSDFNLKGKIIKFLIPLRNSLLWRSIFIFPKRFIRTLMFMFGYKFKEIRYKKLQANYETYWVPDSDACNSIDPHDAILWFESHSFKCLSHPIYLKALLVRNGALVFKKIEE